MQIEEIFRLANLVVLFLTLIVASYTDVTQRKVYNWTTYPAAALGLALGYLAAGAGQAPSLAGPGVGLLDRLAGLGLGFGILFAFNRAHDARAVGVGDVKLMGAIGALVGGYLTLWALFWGSLVGAVIAVWVLLGQGKLMRGVGRSLMAAIRLGRSSTPQTPNAPPTPNTPPAPNTLASPSQPASSGEKAAEGEDDAPVAGHSEQSEGGQSEAETPPEQQRIPYGVALAFGTMVAWFLHAPTTGW